MFASTHVLVALALSPTFASPVSRWIARPLTTTSVAALTVVTPPTEEVRVTVHWPVVPIVAHVVGVGGARVPGPLSLVNVITVPAGALTKPPAPELTLTVPVN